MIQLQSGIFIGCKNQWHYESCIQMDGTWKYHSKLSTSESERHAWYIFTYKCIIARNNDGTTYRLKETGQYTGSKEKWMNLTQKKKLICQQRLMISWTSVGEEGNERKWGE